jgi:putative copper resistance protein D
LAWLLLDFGLLATILRAAVLSVEALVLGGILFIAFVLLPLNQPSNPNFQRAVDRWRRGMSWAAVALMLAQGLYAAVDTAVLMSTVHLPLSNVIQVLERHFPTRHHSSRPCSSGWVGLDQSLSLAVE